MMSEKQFDFGSNWDEFSKNALTPQRVEQAKRHLTQLLGDINLNHRSFVDIGFGQGLSLLVATSMGVRPVGCDINPLCAAVLKQNRARAFPELNGQSIPIVIGSILDDNIVRSLRELSPDKKTGTYEIVHSWGVLHHTGNMATAIRNAASLVAPAGYFIIALYNRHWTSRPWLTIKRLYVNSPMIIQKMFVAILWPVIFLAKWLVTRRSPFRQTRGMEFYYNVVDWVGGYPYEYGSVDEVTEFVEGLGFQTERIMPAEVPTGCNEFVFKRVGAAV
jgi:2-polyprenyl-3-methyl-5-hydroxy-6-metoxy-1,4-benzoquinol methylase